MSNSSRLISAVNFIGRIIVIGLTFRVASLTRKNADTTLMHKIVSSAFGLIILAGMSISLIQAKATWVITAYNHELLEPRWEFSGGVIGYVGTTTLTVEAPFAMGRLFFDAVTLIILSINWTPKKS